MPEILGPIDQCSYTHPIREQAERLAALATSARTYYQRPKRARHTARAITATAVSLLARFRSRADTVNAWIV